MLRVLLPLGPLVLGSSLFASAAQSQDSADDASPPDLVTRWAAQVSADNVHPEYPRPQMVREEWQNLNGNWDYAIGPKQGDRPQSFDGKILVPFPIESRLSGVGRRVLPRQRLWYRRTFEASPPNNGERLLLHFGAVDWETQVFVNGKPVGSHRGGYDPFSFDITDALQTGGQQELVVSVWDPTDTGSQPRGKQVRRPRGIWYTPVTGIWQTVWLEPVPAAHVRVLKITPDIDAGTVTVEVDARLPGEGARAQITVRQGDREVASKSAALVRDAGQVDRGTASVTLEVPDARLWSPDDPFLYDLQVALESGGQGGDSVAGYFGMRKIHMQKDKRGFNRMFLNNEPLFQYGPLDQGWWPDGLYTPPTDEALRYDIEVTKQLGFNMLRKHVKVEPARFYDHCDRMGMLVWQDMPSGMKEGDRQKLPRGAEHDAEFSPEEAAQFRAELKALIDTHYNHPSIVVWVPYNEGWGQHQTNDVLKWVKEYDPTRLVGGPSGWEDRGWGDLKDMHSYPGPGMFPAMEDRISVLGEFGGLGLPVPGHLWVNRDNWGYRNYKNREELAAAYERLIVQLPSLIADGLAAAVYTQTTDVEIEVNGLMTYDRAEIKFDPEQLTKLHKPLYETPRTRKTVLPTSEAQGHIWRWTTDKPGEGWQKADFDDEAWWTGEAGFGTEGTPGIPVRTTWNTPEIWIRRAVELPDRDWQSPHLRIHHDEDAEIYINGILAATVTGYVTAYVNVPLTADGAKALQSGRNVIAVHCKQTGGGQSIDVGLVDLVAPEDE